MRNQTSKEVKEFEEKLLEVRRVTKVTTWWRRLSFRATVLIWNRNWKIWLWIWKGADVTIAIKKAVHDAYKRIHIVKITNDGSVLYPVTRTFKACMVKIIPAAPGTWLKAWSSVRLVLELAWFKNILSKIVWSSNKLNNALATIEALANFKLKSTHLHKVWDTTKNATPDSESEDTVENKKTKESQLKPKLVAAKKEKIATKSVEKKSNDWAQKKEVKTKKDIK